jgi:hypothetical protein
MIMEVTETIKSQARVTVGGFVAPGITEWGYRGDVVGSILFQPTFLGAFSFPTFAVRVDPTLGAIPTPGWETQCTVSAWLGCDNSGVPTPPLMTYGADPRIVGVYELYPHYTSHVDVANSYDIKWTPAQGVCATESKRKAGAGGFNVYFTQFRVTDELKALRPGVYPAVQVYQTWRNVTFWGTNNP